MKLKFTLVLAILCTSVLMVSAQTSTVTGYVYSKDTGEPITGAAVVATGTQIGTSAATDGKFVLSNIPSSVKTLTVMFIGMKTVEVPISEGLMRIELESESEHIEELLVVAFGQQTRASFTGSASVVSSETIAQRQVTNAMDAIAGRVAGLQSFKADGSPESTPKLRIRGITTLSTAAGSNDPLIILDGAPYDGGWNNLNPNDIASMTVLKDAASNSLYGARGANGVIMITTKRAKQGEATVTFDARVGVNKRIKNTYDFITEPGQYYELQYGALNNYFRNARGQNEFDAHVSANQAIYGATTTGGLGYVIYDVPDGQFLVGSNGRLNPNATLGRVIEYNGEEYLLQADDWYDETFRSAVRQEYNVSISGGNDRGTYYSSLGYLDHGGVVDGSNLSRFTGRINASYKVKKWLTSGANVSYTRSDVDRVGAGSAVDGETAYDGTSMFGHAVSTAPIYPIWLRKPDGSFYTDQNGRMYDYGTGMNGGLQRPVLPNTNALQTAKVDENNYITNSVNAMIYADFMFLKDFKLTVNMNVTNNESRWTVANNPWYGYYASNKGMLYKYHYKTFSTNMQQLLNYNKQLGIHNISVMVGHEWYKSTYDYLSGHRKGMYSFYDNKELAGAITVDDANSYQRKYNTEGWLFRGMYDYDGKYFFSASFRRDGSSRFYPDSRRWGNFWSVGGAWLLHKENWFDVEWIDMLKVKASYGEQGNDRIGDWQYTDLYTLVDDVGNPGLTLYTKGNKNITWEKNGNFSTGIEFELLDRRISGTFEYFRRKTTDMLIQFFTPPSIGYTGYYDNVGDMLNQGIELELNADILRRNDLRLSVYVNLTHFKNKVTRLNEEKRTEEIDGYHGYSSGSYFIAEGASRYTWKLKKFAGVNDEGKPTWYYNEDDGSRQITDEYSKADNYICGSALPDAYGGFGTNFSWKNIDFAASFSYQIGGKSYDGGYASFMSAPQSNRSGLNFHVDVLKSWTPENPSSTIPRWQYGDEHNAASSDRWLTDASYLSLDNLTLGYTIPSKITSRWGVSSLRVSVSWDNVFLTTKRDGFDPRYNISGMTSTTSYTPIRTISGGLRIQF